MIPLYVPATNTVVLDYVTRYVHPVTGEVYGGADYNDAAKIEQIGAVPLRFLTPAEGLSVAEWVVEDDLQNPGGKQYRPVMLRIEQPAAGLDAATWEIVDDPAHPGDLLKRPATTTPWVITAADREDKAAAVNAERTRRLSALTVTMDGNVYEADLQSRGNLTSLVAAINAGIPVGDEVAWRDANDVIRLLKPSKLIELAGLMLAAVSAIYGKSWTLKDTTISEIIDPVAFRAYGVTDDGLWSS